MTSLRLKWQFLILPVMVVHFVPAIQTFDLNYGTQALIEDRKIIN